jgi:2-polyprenyl-3-methyl-5-hydroxy-6-metoxy-1,4-benzoquinol methylase
MDSTMKFWDKMANRYSKSPVADEESYQVKLAKTREYFTSETEVLEFGCGTGSTAITHSPFVKHIQCVDISQSMIDIAQKKVDDANLTNIDFTQSNFDEFTDNAGHYDVVLGLSILHLLDDRMVGINKAFELLKPGGVFISSTVCIEEKAKWLKYIAPVGQYFGLLPLLRSFTVSQLEKSLLDAGFEPEHKWVPRKGAAAFFIVKKPD